jgi:NADH:ubiquinone oxidoreductase subunit F (NADH-binding)
MANGEWAGEFVLVFADEAAATAFRDRLLVEA